MWSFLLLLGYFILLAFNPPPHFHTIQDVSSIDKVHRVIHFRLSTPQKSAGQRSKIKVLYRSRFCSDGDVAPFTDSQLLCPNALNKLLLALFAAAIDAAAAEAAAEDCASNPK